MTIKSANYYDNTNTTKTPQPDPKNLQHSLTPVDNNIQQQRKAVAEAAAYIERNPSKNKKKSAGGAGQRVSEVLLDDTSQELREVPGVQGGVGDAGASGRTGGRDWGVEGCGGREREGERAGERKMVLFLNIVRSFSVVSLLFLFFFFGFGFCCFFFFVNLAVLVDTGCVSLDLHFCFFLFGER